MTQDNLQLVQQAYGYFKTGNLPALLGQMDPNIEWQLPKIPNARISGTRHGRGQVQEFFGTLATDQETISFEPREFVAQGDTVVAIGHCEWRVKETGKAFESDFVHVFTVRNGAVVRFRELLDSQAAALAYQK